MVLGNDILGYRGDVALGLNGDGLSSYGDTDTKDLSNSVFNLAYLNMQKNKDVWQQKIKDRDDGMKLIAEGQLRLNNALPKDREKLMGMIDQVKKVYFDNGGDVKSNPKVWLDLNDKLSKFQTANNVAISRLVSYNEGLAEAANERNPVAKKQMLEHWQKQTDKDLYQMFDPYQKTLDWDPKIVLPDLPVNESTPYRVGDYDVTDKTTDINKAWLQYADAYQFDDKGTTAPNVDAFYDNYFGLDGLKPHDAVAQTIELTNQKLKKIAELQGYNTENIAGLPDYLKPIQLAQDPADGQFKPTETKQLAAFKIALALKYQHTKDIKLNKDYSVIDKNKMEVEKIKHENKKLDAESDASRALASQRRSYIPLNQAKAKYWNSKSTQADNEEKITNIFDDVLARTKTMNFKGEGDKEVVWVGDLPQGFSQVLSGVNKKGEPIALKPLKRSNGAEYFEVGKSSFYISPTGKRYSEAQIQNDFKKQDKYPTLEAFKSYLDEVGFKQDKELIGANGRGTSQSTIQGLRIINNKSRSGKSDEILSQPEDNVDQ